MNFEDVKQAVMMTGLFLGLVAAVGLIGTLAVQGLRHWLG